MSPGTTIYPGQPYRFGWVYAVNYLTGIVNPTFVSYWTTWAGSWGIPLTVLWVGWSLAIGIAAAAVQPWSWYVLLVGQLMAIMWTGLYAILVAPTWRDIAIGTGVPTLLSIVFFSYFYKRRALFRAQWRWRWLERWWPWVKGPETIRPDARRGFIGLTLRGRWLFLGAVLVVSLLRLLRRF